MKSPRNGFTLIELLVVISIIALFSSVVLAGVSTLRTRAQEATIKANLRSIQGQAALSFNNTGDYSTASSAVSAIIEGIDKSGGTAAFYTLDNTHYVVSAKLNSNPTKIWSVSDQSSNITWEPQNATLGSVLVSTASSYCSSSVDKRLPTFEELKSLCDSGGMTNASGFVPGFYVSSTMSGIRFRIVNTTDSTCQTPMASPGALSYVHCVY